MSGHVQDGDAGDVLSSIRRLVTDATPPPARPPAGRLVLTPALRVDTPTAANQPSHADARAADGGAADAATTSPPQFAATSRPSHGLALQEPGAAASISPHASDGASLERTIAELEAAVAASFDDWEPEDADGIASTGTRAHAPTDDIAARSEDPADASEDARPSQARTWADAVHEEADAQAYRATERQAALDSSDAAETAELADLAEEEDLLLDEAALRDLVAQIVREELRGTLGERITRNVRKLVRSEVARAIASRDLVADREDGRDQD